MSTQAIHEASLLRAIKFLGTVRAQELVDFINNYEGVSSSHKKQTKVFHAKLGELVQAKCPPGQRGRRKGQVDSNSMRQVIFRHVREYLHDKDSVACADLLIHLEKVTGYTYIQCKMNAFQCEGIQRRCGKWSLLKVRHLKAA